MRRQVFSKRSGLWIALTMMIASTPIDTYAFIERYDLSQQGVMWFNNSDSCSSGGTASLAGKDNIEKILNFFMAKGLSLAQASGFIGNMAQESGTVLGVQEATGVKIPNEKAIQGQQTENAPDDYNPVDGTGFGLVQWTFTSRQEPLRAKAREMNSKVTDINVQLEYIWDELNGDYSRTLEALKATDNPEEAAVIIHGPPDPGYESSGDSPDAVRSVRGGDAKKIYDHYKDAAPSGSNFTDPSSGATSSTDPSSAVNSESGDGSGAGITVALDPGHGPNHEKIDDASGLSMKETNNQPEGSDALDVANRVKTMLERDGYTVTTTKSASPGEDITFRDRADVAKNANAQIGISIHTTPGGEAQNQATPQRLGQYREYNGKRLEFGNTQTAQLSEQYATAIAQARTESEGHNVNTDNIEMMRADLASKGTTPMVPLFADTVPWVYNEIVQDSGTAISEGTKQKYAEGIYKGIKSANIQAGAKSDGCGSSGGDSKGIAAAALKYAWKIDEPNAGSITPTEDWADYVRKAPGEGLYVGGTAYPGIDCGGWTTGLITLSGWDKDFNYGAKLSEGAANTYGGQEPWMKKNWELIGEGPQDPANLQPGDVAINHDHTFAFVGEVGDGFGSNIASASWDTRAPQAGGDDANEPGFRWYRKK